MNAIRTGLSLAALVFLGACQSIEPANNTTRVLHTEFDVADKTSFVSSCTLLCLGNTIAQRGQ